MILDHKFATGQNTASVTCKVDLSKVRTLHFLAENQAQKLEKLQKDIANHDETIFINFKIGVKTELRNLNDQLEKLKHALRDQGHLNNMLYLTKQIITIERDLIKEQQLWYKSLDQEIGNIILLHKYIHEADIARLVLTPFNKRGQEQKKIAVKDHLPKAFLAAIQMPYVHFVLGEYEGIIREILNRKIRNENITFDDVLEIQRGLKEYIIDDPEKLFMNSLLKSLMDYMKREEVFRPFGKDVKVPEKLNSNEARLIYIVLCVFNLVPILTDREKKGSFGNRRLGGGGGAKMTGEKTSAGVLPLYNDQIIQNIKKMYTSIFLNKHRPPALEFETVESSYLLELYKSEIKN
ncbi:hypothetical protein [Pedobacter immunditicola]|uniref:hypothetical protein n=1 Tax=Pedobacter immunditicola TaxID=3133440 RepID=UPI0030988436